MLATPVDRAVCAISWPMATAGQVIVQIYCPGGVGANKRCLLPPSLDSRLPAFPARSPIWATRNEGSHLTLSS